MKGLMRMGAALAVVLTLAGCQKSSSGVDGARIEAEKPGEWLTVGRTYDEQRFSPLTQINKTTVSKLGLAWWAEFDTDRGQEATPVIADGVLYATSAWSKVYAFDAKTGKALWSYDPQVPGEKGFNACCDVVNRGVALWRGKVYVGTIDGRLVALDGKTGKVAWSVQTTDPNLPYAITGAPRAIKGKILIGNAGSEFPVRGYISAYDAATGKMAWRFHMTPNPTGAPDGAASDKIMKEKAYATWSDGAWKLGGGGATPWEAITYDPKADVVMIGTGNAGPWDDNVRTGGTGDNLFVASIVALRPDTGEYVWHYQTTPRDAWDYDAVQHIMTADLTINGKPTRVAMQANKNGFFYVLETATGKLISAEKFVPATWAERIDVATGRPVEAPFARYKGDKFAQLIVGAGGGHNWQPMAFSPKERLVYIPAQTAPATFAQFKGFKYVPGAQNTASWRQPMGPGAAKPPPPAGPPAFNELVAWDPVTQKARWRVKAPLVGFSGVMATGGDLVFYANSHWFSAYDAATGEKLWSYDAGANPLAAASSYEIDGEQYVALVVGWGGVSAFAGDQPRRKGRLLVFKIGGNLQQKPYPEFAVMPPLDLTGAEATTGDPARGGKLFVQYCGGCHRGPVYLPNLPHSPAILSVAGFNTIVLDGAKKSHGMAPFRRFLGEPEAEDLRAFLLWQAKNEAAAPPPSAGRDPGHP